MIDAKKAKTMDRAALEWTLKDLNEVIAIQEPASIAGTMHCPKLGTYYDERHAILAELARRDTTPRCCGTCGQAVLQ